MESGTTGNESFESSNLLEEVRRRRGWKKIEVKEEHLLVHPKDGYFIQIAGGEVWNLTISQKKNKFDLVLKQTNHEHWTSNGLDADGSITFHKLNADSINVDISPSRVVESVRIHKASGSIIFHTGSESQMEFTLTPQ